MFSARLIVPSWLIPSLKLARSCATKHARPPDIIWPVRGSANEHHSLLKIVVNRHVTVCVCSTEAGAPEKKKVEFVLLLDTNGKVLGTRTKEEALMFAKKHDYHLVKVDDPHHAEAKKRKIYKLVTSKDMLLQRDLGTNNSGDKGKQEKGTVKSLLASSKITDSDLDHKLKSIKKWLEKNSEIRVAISGTPDGSKQLEHIFEKFQASLGSEARFLQKRIKDGVLKFVIIPPSEKKVQSQKPQPKAKDSEE